jgi:hypothetical protein
MRWADRTADDLNTDPKRVISLRLREAAVFLQTEG